MRGHIYYSIRAAATQFFPSYSLPPDAKYARRMFSGDVKAMEKTLQSLQGLPVVCAGKRVGRVAQAALSDDLRRMDGLWVDAGLGGARFVPAEEIEVLGGVSVTVDAPGRREKPRRQPLFRRAVTTDGARLGAVVGARVDTATFQVTSLTVSTGYWDDLLSGRLDVRHFAVTERGEVVADLQAREEDEHAERNGQGNGRRSPVGRRGGDAVRRDELAH